MTVFYSAPPDMDILFNFYRYFFTDCLPADLYPVIIAGYTDCDDSYKRPKHFLDYNNENI